MDRDHATIIIIFACLLMSLSAYSQEPPPRIDIGQVLYTERALFQNSPLIGHSEMENLCMPVVAANEAFIADLKTSDESPLVKSAVALQAAKSSIQAILDDNRFISLETEWGSRYFTLKAELNQNGILAASEQHGQMMRLLEEEMYIKFSHIINTIIGEKIDVLVGRDGHYDANIRNKMTYIIGAPSNREGWNMGSDALVGANRGHIQGLFPNINTFQMALREDGYISFHLTLNNYLGDGDFIPDFPQVTYRRDSRVPGTQVRTGNHWLLQHTGPRGRQLRVGQSSPIPESIEPQFILETHGDYFSRELKGSIESATAGTAETCNGVLADMEELRRTARLEIAGFHGFGFGGVNAWGQDTRFVEYSPGNWAFYDGFTTTFFGR